MEEVAVGPLNLRNRKRSVGRPRKKDKKVQKSIRVRESVLESIDDRNLTEFFESCRLSSMNVNAVPGKHIDIEGDGSESSKGHS